MKKKSNAKAFLINLLRGKEELTGEQFEAAAIMESPPFFLHYQGRHKLLVDNGRSRAISDKTYARVKQAEKEGLVRLFEITVTDNPFGIELWNSYPYETHPEKHHAGQPAAHP